MRLKSLTLHGFKTFVQRTQLAFEPGITAVVGPNGSGKSNVADAFRWVLGEQSLRALRGKRTQDVLFAGGTGRAPAGMAEVTLDLDELDGQPDLPYRELSVVRRAYRSGENEYYLNRDRARLRDVLDVLGRLGLGADGLAVVGQGAIDAALSLRPEERRALLENAAAIGHLHLRLDDARERLRETGANLSRANDLLVELTPRLKSLERQARLAREREALQAEFYRGLAAWFAHLWSGPSCARAGADGERDRALAAMRAIDAEQDALDEALGRLRDALAELDRDVASRSQRLGELESELLVLDRTRVLDDERAADLARRRDDLEATRSRLRDELEEVDAARQGHERERGELTEALRRQDAELVAAEGLLATWERQRAALEDEVRAARKRHASAQAGRASADARLAAAQERLDHLGALQAEGAERAAELAAREATARDHLVVQGQAVEAARRALDQLNEQRQALVDQQELAREQLARLGAELAVRDRELQTLRARVDALRQTEEAGTGYFAGVRAVLQAANGHGTFHLDGILGVVARLVEAAPRQELAIETALGAHLQDVVVERWVNAEAAIAELKRRNAGRATFLPLDTLRPPHPAPAPSGSGIIGVASRLVEIDPRYRIVSEFLLGHTLIVESLGVAREVLQRCSPSWQIVTLEGELARPSGIVTGGSGAGLSRGALARFREQRDLQRQVDERAAGRERLVEDVATRQGELDRLAPRLEAATRASRAAEERLRQASAARAEAQRQVERASQDRARHVEEAERLVKQRAEAERRRDDARATLEEAARTGDAAQRETERAQDELSRLEREHGENVAAALARQTERERTRLRRDAAEAALRHADARRAQIVEQTGVIDRHLSDLGEELAKHAARQAEARERHATLRTEQHAVRRQLAEKSQARVARAEELERRERERRHLKARAREAGEALTDAERRLDHAEVELAALRRQIEVELGQFDEHALARDCLRIVAPDHGEVVAPLVPLVNPEQHCRRLETLRHRLDSLPAGNEVIAEYEAVRDRVDALREQTADLERTAATLQQTIDETRQTMQLRFDGAFEAVSAGFTERFAQLFGGGTARLILDREDEGAGIEIIAQPPGKRSQNLANLSGGERALTAAALLFALIEANPPPFCVLDEVDAALDESNVGRFCAVLQELSHRTQFVVITHNRRTMEAAGAIYGLTLENRCESRVLSMRLPG